MLRHKILVLLGSLAVLGLAACGGGAAMSTGPVRSGAVAQSAGGAAAQPAGSSGAAAQAPGSAAAKPSAAGSVPSVTRPPGTRLQISATIVLLVGSGQFDRSLRDVIALVEGAGGYLSAQNAEAADQNQPLRSGQVTFQVPVDKVDPVLSELSTRGNEQSVNVTSTDVSQQYVDLQARLRNAEAQRDAMLALMQQARTVNDIVQVDNQLGQITGQIEQLKGQIAYLDGTTSYATVAVTIREAAASAPHDEWGLQTALSQAVHNLMVVVAFLVVLLGTTAPLLVAAAVAFLAVRLAWRRLGARSPAE